MRIAFWLPRHESSVAIARQGLDSIFRLFGVHRDCRDDISLAVSEACTNAVRYADGSDMYQLRADAEDSHCVIEVVDRGPGADPDAPPAMPESLAEGGRGLAIIRFVTDSVELKRRGGRGLTVRMCKTLTWEHNALGASLC